MNGTINYLPEKNEIQIFQHAADNRLPVLIKGPTGCGKTRFVQHMAGILARPVYIIACHNDLTSADLIGRRIMNNGESFWQDGPLTRAVKEGGICYLDEIVLARKDTTAILHALSDHRRVLFVEHSGEELEANPDFMLVISYNPADQKVLKGLKPSTRQRFVGLQFSYPVPEREVVIICQETDIDKDTAQCLVSLGNELRKSKELDMEEVASTRLLIYTAKLINSGLGAKEACMSCLALPLTDEPDTISAIERIIDRHFKA